MKRILLTSPNGSWEVMPVNTLAMIPLGIILSYLLFGCFRLWSALRDVYSEAPNGWVFFPWRSKWAPDTTPLIKPKFHLIAAAILLSVYLYLGGEFGWIDYVKQE